MIKPTEPEFFSKQVAEARRFYIQKSAKDARIQIICGGYEYTTPDYDINRKNFPYYCIEFVTKGSGMVTLNDRDYVLKTGTIFSYGPGISQKIITDHEKPIVKYFIDFTGKDSKQLLTLLSPLGTAIHVNRPDEIIPTFENLLAHGLSDSPYKSKTCSVLLEYLFYQIAELIIDEQTSPSRAFVTYQNCRQYIKDHCVELNSLKDMADACMIDHTYLCRLFKRFDTQTPYQYLLNLKMAYAADRFQETSILVKEIAHELGFSDPFHFTRVFKKVFGISPQTFKRLR